MNCSFDYWVGNTQTKKTLKESSWGPPFGVKNRIYDLASLTKVIVTGTLLILEAKSKGESLEALQSRKVSELIPELNGTVWHNLNLGELWNHRSGFRAHTLLFNGLREAPFSLNRRNKLHSKLLSLLLKEKRNHQGQTLYSDLGFILLCIYLERKYSKNLMELWEDFLESEKLWGHYFSFCPPKDFRSLILPTEMRHLSGEVNDDNAAAMNGISSHAGLFASIEDVKNWLFWMANFICNNSNFYKSLSSATDRFVCGWDTAAQEAGVISQAGQVNSDFVRGFLGWTGTAFWWDMQSGQAAILLSNRVYPSHSEVSQKNMKHLRHSFFTRVWQDNLNGLDELFDSKT